MIVENFIVYDAVDMDVHYCNTEDEAKKLMQELIASSLEDGEWMDDVESIFIAKIMYIVKPKKIPTTEEYRLDTGISSFTEMEIVPK